MIKGLIGKKLGMTQIFTESGDSVPVTVIEVGPCVVQAVRDKEKNGYLAVQLGFMDVKEKKLRKPQRDEIKAKGLPAKRHVREIRCDVLPDIKIGDKLTVSMFQEGDYIDVQGISKGKGYQGGMKRCGWLGGCETHGSMSHRAPGSVGASSFPSKVDRGHGGAGHMGSDKKTIQNLKVIKVDTDQDTLLVKGSIPGSNGTVLVIKFAKKKKLAPRAVKAEVKEKEEGNDKEGKA
ncbi:MAG: 50S ribosomal protein L3 [Candidatus Omnitrophica bacterium]|nr:50S ribosomal protein L3 [Candidatus Omnitrophota bacterium]